MRKQITLCKVNGEANVSRSVLVRNVIDFLEGNEDYGEMSFSECQDVCDAATKIELLQILAELLTEDQIRAIGERAYL